MFHGSGWHGPFWKSIFSLYKQRAPLSRNPVMFSCARLCHHRTGLGQVLHLRKPYLILFTWSMNPFLSGSLKQSKDAKSSKEPGSFVRPSVEVKLEPLVTFCMWQVDPLQLGCRRQILQILGAGGTLQHDRSTCAKRVVYIYIYVYIYIS